ncbi:MAG: META domain-containing protein [Prevotella sp.]|nr:META domain-containing protein [Prevotella sp.]
MKTRNLMMAALFAAMLSACNTAKTVVRTSGGLFGEWKIEQAMGKSTAGGDSPAVINFSSDGRINGNASVNSFFGGYTSDGKSMSFTHVGMTRMMGQSMDIEDAVTEAINSTARISINGDDAVVYDKDGNVVMKLTRTARK